MEKCRDDAWWGRRMGRVCALLLCEGSVLCEDGRCEALVSLVGVEADWFLRAPWSPHPLDFLSVLIMRLRDVSRPRAS